MSKKLISVMDTTFRDGFQSVLGGRVLMDDFMPAVEAAREAELHTMNLVVEQGFNRYTFIYKKMLLR